ncbi:anti-sigma factor family protein [Alteribacter natronophilus]|uniref:anti-sigma factor family protein n=1 Tax=Alteribacter natronophilus TaxID=2583810 RepID=UPI00110EF49E|nr:anti-sigma factor [Alteribacter natronophilus]TMW70079.1 anti-sigma factor [Alteribacter natronophilus]
MACEKTKIEQLHKYLDEDMTLLEKKQLEQHLKSCSECEQHLRELRKTIAIVQSTSHVEAPPDFTAGVMNRLPKQSKPDKWKTWMRKHPFVLAAAVFMLLFVTSVSSFWSGGTGSQITVQGQGNFHIDEERSVVVVPEGETIEGNLIVRNGDIEVEGEVLGNITVINGDNYLASAGHVAGEINEVNQVLSWIWYETKSFMSEVVNVFNGSDPPEED